MSTTRDCNRFRKFATDAADAEVDVEPWVAEVAGEVEVAVEPQVAEVATKAKAQAKPKTQKTKPRASCKSFSPLSILY